MSIRNMIMGFGAILTLFTVGCASDPTPARSDADATSAREPARFVCREYDRATDAVKQRTVILQQTDKQGLKEGVPLQFAYELYEGASVIAKEEASGTAQTEDVMFDFSANGGKLGFRIFLDEMNESSLSIDGKDAGDFICYSGHLVCAGFDRQSEVLDQSTVVLTKVGKAPVVEGTSSPFELERFEGAQVFTRDSVRGKVDVEDVNFAFQSDDGKTSFHHFMDEIDQASLHHAGKDADFICH